MKRKRNTTTYGELANMVGSNATYMAMVLGAIDLIGERLGDPPLSPLVESSRRAGPGRGYFVWSFIPEEDRIQSTKGERSIKRWMKEEWKDHLRETYEYDGWHEIE